MSQKHLSPSLVEEQTGTESSVKQLRVARVTECRDAELKKTTGKVITAREKIILLLTGESVTKRLIDKLHKCGIYSLL